MVICFFGSLKIDYEENQIRIHLFDLTYRKKTQKVNPK